MTNDNPVAGLVIINQTPRQEIKQYLAPAVYGITYSSYDSNHYTRLS
ncbi:hypothetical protein [Lentibacillus sp. CBA3610]|nr:hypothetical protein [Lentibacillus sp. CBA3610]